MFWSAMKYFCRQTFLQAGATVGEGQAREERAGAFAPLVAGVVGLDAREVGRAAGLARAEELSVRIPVITGVGAGVAALVRAFVQEDLGGLGEAVLDAEVSGDVNRLQSVAGVLAQLVFGELGRAEQVAGGLASLHGDVEGGVFSVEAGVAVRKADLEAGGGDDVVEGLRAGGQAFLRAGVQELLGRLAEALGDALVGVVVGLVGDEVGVAGGAALELLGVRGGGVVSRAALGDAQVAGLGVRDVVWTCGRAVLGRDEVLSVVRTFLQAGATVGEGEAREERAGTFAPLVAGVVGLDAREVGRAADVARAEQGSVGVSVVAGVGAGLAALVRAFVQEDLGGLGEAVLDAEVSGDVNGLQSVAGVLAQLVFGELGRAEQVAGGLASLHGDVESGVFSVEAGVAVRKADLEAGGGDDVVEGLRTGGQAFLRVGVQELLGRLAEALGDALVGVVVGLVGDEVGVAGGAALELLGVRGGGVVSRAALGDAQVAGLGVRDVGWTCGRAVLGRDEVLSVVRTFLQAGATVGEGEAREERAGTFAPLVAGVVGLDAREVGRAADVARAEKGSVGVSVVAGVGAGLAALVRAFVQEDLGGLGEAVLDAEVSGDVNGLQSVAGVLAQLVFGELGRAEQVAGGLASLHGDVEGGVFSVEAGVAVRKADLEAGGGDDVVEGLRTGGQAFLRVGVQELLGRLAEALGDALVGVVVGLVGDEVGVAGGAALELLGVRGGGVVSRAALGDAQVAGLGVRDVGWTCGRAVLGRDEVLSVVRTFLQAGATVGEGEAREERAGTFAPLVGGVVGLDAREVGRAADVARAEKGSVGVSVVAGVGARTDAFI
ncbi:Hypothetical_protein [Hexamita inflata]|uniref:Hypothetical_protein n=1 Tax=Hexamita inflata TaxID=28002 RepID=A0AA86V3N7_9EUKA|nr:Hypothetical protein HINF_LOCUS62776 [Hexamita inflata]